MIKKETGDLSPHVVGCEALLEIFHQVRPVVSVKVESDGQQKKILKEII